MPPKRPPDGWTQSAVKRRLYVRQFSVLRRIAYTVKCLYSQLITENTGRVLMPIVLQLLAATTLHVVMLAARLQAQKHGYRWDGDI
jgi:branched-subunit amino acid permease